MAQEISNQPNEKQLILFSLGRGNYGIPIENVNEIKKMEEITVVPKAPKFIEGVINLRGNVVPVIDLRKRFGMENCEMTKKTKIIIVEVGKRQFGVIVDAVAEVVTLSTDQIEPSLPTVSGLKAEFINGIGKMNTRLIIILEISKILQSTEEIQIEARNMEFSLTEFRNIFELKEKMDSIILTEEEFNKFSDFIHEITGIYLKDTKITLLSNRLRKRLKATGTETFSKYYELVTGDGSGKEVEEMINEVSTNETYFFRSVKHYEALIDFIIPEMIKSKRLPVTVWSAGCASGEEAYTLAMMLDKKGLLERKIIDIFASDINTNVINEAKRGVYDLKRLRSTPQEYADKYFTKFGKNQFLLDEKITNSVSFSRINLKKDGFKRKYDIILCRNVMIYFDRDDQKNVVDKFYDVLNDGGYFIIGHSEMLYYINSFFKYKKIADAPVYYKE